jgi:hypothetical protein
MTEAARKRLDALDSLPEADRREIVREILRRAALGEHESPGDDDLVAAADETFLELDRREREGRCRSEAMSGLSTLVSRRRCAPHLS